MFDRMFLTRTLPVIVVTALVTCALMSGLHLIGAARADAPRTMECSSNFKGATEDKKELALQEWANAEMAAGRTQFFATNMMFDNFQSVCAW